MNDAARGFMLLEVLVAFMILAIALSALLRATGTGLRAAAVAERQLAAADLAETLLAEVGTSVPIGVGSESGSTPTLAWDRILAPMPTLDTSAVPGATAVVPYRVSVAVHDAGRARTLIELHSVRLAPIDAGLR